MQDSADFAPKTALEPQKSKEGPLVPSIKWDGCLGLPRFCGLDSGARLQPLEQAPRCGGAPSTSLEHAPH